MQMSCLNGKWIVVQSRPAAESRVESALRTKGYETFLPTYVRHRLRERKEIRSTESLFPGYVFCRFDSAMRTPLVTTPGVIRVVCVAGVPAAVSETEIDSLKRIARNGVAAIPWPVLAGGQPVRIVAGPLAGLEGVVSEVRGPRRLLVSVSLLQRSVAIELDRSWLVRPTTSPQ